MSESPRVRFVKVTNLNSCRFEEIDFSADLMKYITGRPLTTEEAIRRYTFNMDHPYFGSYFVEEFKTDKILGFAVIKEKGNFAEIGYMVLNSFKGNGLATVINKILIEICQKHLHSYQICAFVDERNIASIRVLEKSGMNKSGVNQEEGITSLQFLI